VRSGSETTNWHSFHFPGKNVSVMTSTLAIFPHCCGLSSAGAAADAIVDTVCSLTNHTSGKHCASVAVCSDRSCDVEQGLISSFRVHVREGKREVARTSDKRFQSLENRCGGSRIKRGENPSQRLDFVGLATNPKHAARNLEDAVDRLRNCRHGA
jgi:hypothetical protein